MSDERKNYTCTHSRDGGTCGGAVYKCGNCKDDYCIRCSGGYHGQGKCCWREY